MTRKYDMRRRAKRQEETRRRIVEATIELHETIGMARTTISAIAERAGVQRLTVYRHFPDERALFRACSGHWSAANPPPDPTSWTQISDPEERLRGALAAVYAYHRQTEPMISNVVRDAQVHPPTREVSEPYFRHWERMRYVLAARRPGPRPRLPDLALARAPSGIERRTGHRGDGGHGEVPDTRLVTLIHPSAWKGSSPKFASTGNGILP